MRVLYFDCFSGISGDMTVGALCDLGVQPSTFEWELSKLAIGDWHLHFERRQRQNIAGVKFGVHGGATHTHDQDEPADEHGQIHAHAAGGCCGHGHEHAHEHEHAEHEHAHSHDEAHEHDHAHEHSHEHEHGRSYVEIRALLESSELSDFVKKHALSIFHRVAVAEAKIHGVAVEAIGFHEIGALDSITDIVLACVGIEALGVEKIFFSPLQDGRGWTQCAHGRYPIPAPATLEILRGIAPVGQLDEPFECITPTGAAIAAEFGAGFGVMPPMTIEKIGYGLGTRESSSRPNVLRAVLGEIVAEKAANAASGYETDTITQIETNLDDLSPELLGAVPERLLAAGALDAFFTPVQMKKNRPGVMLTVLCESAAVPKIADVIFAETSAFGLRLQTKERLKLAREFVHVETPHGPVRVKLGLRAGKVVQAAPEFEDCRAAAERNDVPARVVYAAALQAHHSKSA
ncbi:MAG: nickel pincer cofactor biosynthesis protein LarC [Verrucomicrobia bacterium]|nr:nickel pincer cofactor biosynthesis protein LarC [Verrucomicrobiota bacterium]